MSSINGCKCSWRDFCWDCLCDDCDGENQKSAYGYIYLVKEEEKINIDENNGVPFNKNGLLKGIVHETGTNKDTIIIEEKGIYEINYYFDNNAKETLAIELTKNSSSSEVEGSRYSPETGSSILYGQVIISVPDNNTILKLVNKSSTINIDKLTSGDDPLVAVSSIYIEKIDDI